VTDTEIYEALCGLLPSQFDEVLLFAGIPRQHLPSANSPQAERADEVVAWIRQSAANREKLLAALGRVQGGGAGDGGGGRDEGWIERLLKVVRRHWLLALLLAVGLIAVAVAHSLLAEKDSTDVTPTTTTTMPTTPSITTRPHVDPKSIVRGTVQVPPQNAAADLTAFAIAVESGDETESAHPDAAGAFTTARLQEGPDLRLTWSLAEGRTSEAAFVLWPLQHPPQSRSPYDGFSASKLTDVVDLEKNAIRLDVRRGEHGLESRARRKADDLRELFAVLEGSARVRVAGLSVARREYKLWQDVCYAAAEFRRSKGRSQISDDQIEVERTWRRWQTTVAAGRDLDRDLVRALNDWAAFSRQAYSRAMGAWPERPLAADLLEDPRWLKRARDDVELVLTSLAELRPFLERSRLLHELGREDRRLYDRLSAQGTAAAGAGPESVAMSQLVHLLAALNTVVGPGEGWSPDA